MPLIVKIVLVSVGVMNLYPLVGVISADQLGQLYGTKSDSPDMTILMRHRAILLGLLGAFMIYAAFNPLLRMIACVAGLISMVSFILLAYAVGDFNEQVHKVVIADIVGSVALVSVLVLDGWPGTNAE